MGVDWLAFLRGLERHVRANPWQESTGREAPGAGPVWEAAPPAADDDIRRCEARLGASLPPSYTAFLRTCDGLTLASHPVGRFLGAGEVEWFRKKHGDWVRAYTSPAGPTAEREPPDDEYYGYADHVRAFFRPSHFRHTVQISAVGDSAVYLLNPQVVWPSGEWEAWFLANWNPGVVRYRSFAELMWEQYRGRAGLPAEQFGMMREEGLPTVYRDPPGKQERRLHELRVPKPPRPFERIARDVRLGDLPTLQRTLKELARLATPEAVDLLLHVEKTHPVDFVRWEAREALQKARPAARGEGARR